MARTTWIVVGGALLVAIVQGVRKASEDSAASSTDSVADASMLLGDAGSAILQRFCADAGADLVSGASAAAAVAGGAAGLEALCCAPCAAATDRAKRAAAAIEALSAVACTSLDATTDADAAINGAADAAQQGAVGAMRNIALASTEGASALARGITDTIAPAATNLSASAAGRNAALDALCELVGAQVGGEPGSGCGGGAAMHASVWKAAAMPLARTAAGMSIGEVDGTERECRQGALNGLCVLLEGVPAASLWAGCDGGADDALAAIAAQLMDGAGAGGDGLDAGIVNLLARAVLGAVAQLSEAAQLRLLPAVCGPLLTAATQITWQGVQGAFVVAAAAACARASHTGLLL